MRKRSVAFLIFTFVSAGFGGIAEDRAARLAELMELTSRSVVADIGAGDGKWSVALANQIGPEGKVFAQEIDSSEIRKIERNVEKARLENIIAILGDERNTELDSECCDAILLRTVYHHFSDSEAMRRELWRILKPGKVIAVIDFAPRGRSSRHGVQPEDVVSEMGSVGFELIDRLDGWENGGNRYLLLFRKPSLP